jgi:hypothetical protein
MCRVSREAAPSQGLCRNGRDIVAERSGGAHDQADHRDDQPMFGRLGSLFVMENRLIS